MQLSHSSVETYSFCSQKYKLQYIDRIRPITTSSNFTWGSAIDAGIAELLKTKLENNPEILPTPFKTFMENWNTVEINGEVQDSKFNINIEYGKKDLDIKLFTNYDLDEIRKYYPKVDPAQFAGEIQDLRESFPWWSYDAMEKTQKMAYNFLCWLCLARKAEMIFQAFEKEILPKIKKVIEIQKKVELENNDGDTVIGFIDFIAELDDGKTYILDLKTASNLSQYAEVQNAAGDRTTVKDSQQLNVYAFVEDIKNAGFVVIGKEIKADGRKKGSLPKVKIKMVLDTIDEVKQHAFLDKFHLINGQIKDNIFNKKEDKKMCMSYGKLCPYYNLCWENKMDGLIKKEPK